MLTNDRIAAWLEENRSDTANLGADPSEVGREAGRLLEAISKGPSSMLPTGNPDRQVEVLHALVARLTKSPGSVELRTLDRAFDLIESLADSSWSVHRDHLLSELALFGWREGRARREPAVAGSWRRRVGGLLLLASDGVLTSGLGPVSERAASLLDVAASSRTATVPEIELGDQELLLAVVQQLAKRLESAPKEVLNEADFFYSFLGRLASPVGQFDEHEYFLSEFALLAATACRVLFRRDDGHRWLALAEASCIGIVGAEVQACRFAFQKLALRTEEREYEEVLELALKWSRTAKNLGHPQEEVKFLFLYAAALREVGRFDEARSVFAEIVERSEEIGKRSYKTLAETNLVECLRAQGDLPLAVDHAEKAVALLAAGDDGAHLTKHRWLLGGILREQCKLSDALATYRAVRREHEAYLSRSERRPGSRRQS